MNDKQQLTEEQVQMLKEQMLVKGTVSPQKKRILGLTDDLLLKHYALVAHKGSSLSSQERQMVLERVAYAVKTERLKMDQVTDAVNGVSNAIENELKRQLEENDSSKAKEQ
tara:strand:- start:10 stop:342 length:333 start_codon:yes stop_codon:yes gene_type:complete